MLLQVTDYLHCISSPGHRISKHPFDSAGASLGLFTDLGPDGLCLPTPGRYRRQEVNDCACMEGCLRNDGMDSWYVQRIGPILDSNPY